MAATEVLPSSPMIPGQVAPWGGFEDYLDFPSPLSTPRLAPATAPMFNAAASSQQPPPVQQGGSKDLGNVEMTEASASVAPPPPPGSSPETLFRYYLSAELRRIGSPADDAIIDRYVVQHYDSFTRAMERQQSQAAEANKGPQPMAGVQPFRSPEPNGPTSAPFLLNDTQVNEVATSAPTSIDPHMVEMNNATQAAGATDSVSSSVAKDTVADRHTSVIESPGSTSFSASLSYRSKSADDDMSEDDDGDEDVKPALKGKSVSLLRTIEETPIEGSIMGPANELRPDPETYRNLTSKEKRQLRNKISARNFRTRRKEHISHLEQQVADRDTLIEGLRQQLAQVTVQNKDLQEEVRALKAKAISTTDVSRIIDALQKSASGTAAPGGEGSSMAPPSLLARSASNSSLNDALASARPSTPSMTSSPRSMSPRPSVSIAKPNTRKDVPSTSGGASGRSFWGGVGGTSGNNFMSVHTVLVPSYDEASLSYLPLDNKHVQQARVQNSDANLLADLTEKLSLKADSEVSMDSTRSSASKKDSDVNAALVSLIDGDDCAPPSYSEAVKQSSDSQAGRLTPSRPNDERVHALILSAISKVFSTGASSSSGHVVQKQSSGAQPQLDLCRLQALLDGRAQLMLVDANGQPWRDEEDARLVENSIRPAAGAVTVSP